MEYTLDAFQWHIQEGNEIPDIVTVDGVLFTMDFYDGGGKFISYGNIKHQKELTISTANRYNDVSDAVVEIGLMASRANHIHYKE